MSQVTPYNVGRFCLSEDDCIEQNINFAAYERGIADAADAFGRNENLVPILQALFDAELEKCMAWDGKEDQMLAVANARAALARATGEQP
jgi:hypothetical protein